MSERSGLVSFRGNGLTLVGDGLEVGTPAPKSVLTGAGLTDTDIDAWSGKVRVLNVVPSLDTPVCDFQPAGRRAGRRRGGLDRQP